jgi:hypothetical protein
LVRLRKVGLSEILFSCGVTISWSTGCGSPDLMLNRVDAEQVDAEAS